MPDSNHPEQEAYSRAYMLVGSFMHHWAILESTLNKGIGKLLGMKQLETAIATSNMQVRSKIHIIKTLVNLKGGSADWCKEAIKDINAIATMSERRNTVAHVSFWPHESGGVEFMPVKAKGNLSFPETLWGSMQFWSYNCEMTTLAGNLEKIVEALTKTTGLLAAYIEATSGAPISPETQNYLAPLLRVEKGPRRANPEKGPESGQGSQEK